MTPNIDTKGRIARAVSGCICILAAGAMIYFAWPHNTAIRWTAAAFIFLAGAFQLYEAKKSWCVARACGLKTPM